MMSYNITVKILNFVGYLIQENTFECANLPKEDYLEQNFFLMHSELLFG